MGDTQDGVSRYTGNTVFLALCQKHQKHNSNLIILANFRNHEKHSGSETLETYLPSRTRTLTLNLYRRERTTGQEDHNVRETRSKKSVSKIPFQKIPFQIRYRGDEIMSRSIDVELPKFGPLSFLTWVL